MTRAVFTCARDGCGLPLHLKGPADEARLYHVSATIRTSEGVTRHLRREGRGGCPEPMVVHPGVEPGHEERPKRL